MKNNINLKCAYSKGVPLINILFRHYLISVKNKFLEGLLWCTLRRV